jgi:transcriptional regulator with XRE-family HTH domain
MRGIDPETGKPKHTQKEVAQELEVNRTRVSQLEKKYDLKPHQITYADNDSEITDKVPSSKDGNKFWAKTRGESEWQSEQQSEEGEFEMTEEGENEPEEWTCTSCGNNTYYSATQYLNKYGDRINKSQREAVNNSEKVCASCGTLH